MKRRLLFSVRYNNKIHDFSWIIDTGSLTDSVWDHFSDALKNICPEVTLPSPGSLIFTETGDGKLELHSKKQLTINGVGLNSRLLKPGDRIILGPLRLFFKSAEPVFEPQAESGTSRLQLPKLHPPKLHLPGLPELRLRLPSFPRFPRLLPAALVSAAAAGAIIAGCMTIPDPATSAGTETAVLPATAAEAREEPPEQTEPPAAEQAEPENISEEETGRLLVVSPGETFPEYDLDILFIHAHPDDESLDFGCLAAMADAAGLTTGLVTFTDGGAGLDLHPFRPQTGIYPEHPMEGRELATVRSTELMYAADVLGMDLLIRLGRKNNPYNRSSDVLEAAEIFEGWGGKETLESQLKLIISRTLPETIAAPEGPGRAREHFEHEAVGSLVAGVMDSAPDGFSFPAPERFITCIDPRQHALYPEAVELDAAPYRRTQLEALSKHKTQNDAVNIGTGFLPEFPSEYYKIQVWRSGQNWEKWIAGLEGSSGSLAAGTGSSASAIQ